MSTVLLVDDEGALLEVMSLVIRRLGHGVVLAHDGEEGLELARQHHPDLIISDLMMPRRNGLDFLKDLRQDPDLQATPFVLMSAARPGKVPEANRFMAKPFDLESLEHLVRETIGSRAVRRSSRPATPHGNEKHAAWIGRALRALAGSESAGGYTGGDTGGAIAATVLRMEALASHLRAFQALASGAVSFRPTSHRVCEVLGEAYERGRVFFPRLPHFPPDPNVDTQVPLDPEWIQRTMFAVMLDAAIAGRMGEIAIRYRGNAESAEFEIGGLVAPSELPRHALESEFVNQPFALSWLFWSKLAEMHRAAASVRSSGGHWSWVLRFDSGSSREEASASSRATNGPRTAPSTLSSASSKSPAGSSGTQRLGGVRILIVEDDPDGRDLLARVFRKAGAEVTCASSVSEASGKLSAEPVPDVMLSDITLPDGSGFELARLLREKDASRRNLAIATTGMSRSEDRARSEEAGFDLHLTKPLDMTRVVENIDVLLRERRKSKPGDSE